MGLSEHFGIVFQYLAVIGQETVDLDLDVGRLRVDGTRAPPLGKVAGSGEVSSLLLYAVIGLLASRASLLELGEAPAWIATGFIVLGIHAVLMLIICKLLKLDLFTAGVASLANIGGTASAPVLAGSYSGSLVPVGILMALMGYVVGTPLAVVCAHIMESLA